MIRGLCDVRSVSTGMTADHLLCSQSSRSTGREHDPGERRPTRESRALAGRRAANPAPHSRATVAAAHGRGRDFAVVAGLEEGAGELRVRFIFDPLARLPLRLRSDLTFGGVREAEALEYVFPISAATVKPDEGEPGNAGIDVNGACE